MSFHKIISICLLLLCCNNGFAQSAVFDSLKLLIQQSSQEDSAQLELLKELADEYYFEDFDSTIHYYDICLEMSQNIPHYDIGLSTLRSFGYTYSFRKNNYEKSLEYFDLARQLAVEEKDSTGLALAYSDMGRIFWKKGQSAKALEHHLMVRKIGEEIGSDNILLRSNLSLGIIYNEEGDNVKALLYYQDALRQADSLDNKVAKGLILNNMGKANQDEEKFDQALEFFQKAEATFIEAGRPGGRLALANYNIGKNYMLQDDFSNALLFYKKSLDHNETEDDKEQRTMILTGIATTMFKMKNYSQAIATAKKGIATLEGVETNLYYEDLYNIIAESHEFLGNTKLSLTAYKAYLEAKEKTEKEETTRKIEELNALYEQQKNETEIQKLNLEQEKSARQLDQSQSFVKLLLAILAVLIIGGFLFFMYNRVRQLKQLDSLKTKLAKDLHDNIGSSLNHIKMFSGRLLRNNNSLTEKKTDVLQIKKISDELMFDLYDMLWSLDKDKSTLGDLTERMQDHIDNTVRMEGYKIRCDFEGLKPKTILSVEVKTNVYAIFKEAIHNILKHTPPSSIFITLQPKKQNRLSLSIKNEFGEKKISPQFSTQKGLENMHTRTAEIKGDLKIIEKTNSFEILLNWKV